ncbi:MAG: transporter substrate-binding domain-containing protein [Eubacterium sp.]|nr:transporter substrate-binding domain-containing protein [Eubacterium sp.]
MKKKIFAFLTVLLIFTLSFTACGGKNGKTLRVGVRSDIVNFGYLNETSGKYYGLEIDIANALAERLGYSNVEFITVEPDNRKEMLMDGKVDCLIACYSISSTRTENFDFSPAYYKDGIKVMVEKSSRLEKPAQLAGKKIGVMSGSNTGPILAIKLREMGMIQGGDSKVTGVEGTSDTDTQTVFNGGITFIKAESYSELSNMLETGEVDAAAMDGAITATYMNEDRQIMDFDVSEQEYGVATQKDSELSPKVAEAIQAMLDDGTIAGLIDKWN